MLRLLIASGLTFFVASHAFAEMSRAEYHSMMAKGTCWGKCAYLSSMEACISCGLSHHTNRRGVLYYCQKLQPKCGRN